jgi:hypothetical protein
MTLETAHDAASKMLDPATGLDFVIKCASNQCVLHHHHHQLRPAPESFEVLIPRILHLRMWMKDMAHAFQETLNYYSLTLGKELHMCRVVERDGPAMEAVKLIDRASSMLYHLWTAGHGHWQSIARLRANIFMPFLHHKVPGKFDFQASMKAEPFHCPLCGTKGDPLVSTKGSTLSCSSCKLFFCSKCDRGLLSENSPCCDPGISRVAALMKRAESEGIVCIEIDD